ncbi:MAG TPA: DUF6311 domain-containing protein, partial [Rhodopila sp.]|nr:DUF6311 domain-containing protein [Rhodopila sp.]
MIGSGTTFHSGCNLGPGRAEAWPDWLGQYGMAGVIGLCWTVYALPWTVLTGTGGMFAAPGGDLPTNLAGHLGFQAPGWHWPLLRAPALAWPDGVSIAMTDSNPVVSLLAKLLAGILGHTVNLLGAWLAACFILQPVAAVYALRAFTALPPVPTRLIPAARCIDRSSNGRAAGISSVSRAAAPPTPRA